MKIIASAIALAFALPAVAQTAPAQHQDHSRHQQHGSPANAPVADHAGHQMPMGKPSDGQPDQHQGHAMKDGCCADKDGNGKMDCCEKMAANKRGDAAAKPKADQHSAQPQAHQNH